MRHAASRSAWSPLAGCESWSRALRQAQWLADASSDGDSEIVSYWRGEAAKLLAPLLPRRRARRAGMSTVLGWIDTQEERAVSAILSVASPALPGRSSKRSRSWTHATEARPTCRPVRSSPPTATRRSSRTPEPTSRRSAGGCSPARPRHPCGRTGVTDRVSSSLSVDDARRDSGEPARTQGGPSADPIS